MKCWGKAELGEGKCVVMLFNKDSVRGYGKRQEA